MRSEKMKSEHYSGGLTREQFLYFELRTVARLTCEGKERKEILKEIFENNLFQFIKRHHACGGVFIVFYFYDDF